jgi:predicted  nucleic acid-binding Zn-ribbon protein
MRNCKIFKSIRSDIGSLKADLSKNNEKLQNFQESVRPDIGNVSADLGRVRSDLTANNERLQQLQGSVKSDISSVKADISAKKFASYKTRMPSFRKT